MSARLSRLVELDELLEDAGRWITLRNGKRLKIDAEGRILAGMPERYRGVSVRDLGTLSHRERELEGLDCHDVGADTCPSCKHTFRTKDEAAAAILAANPQFDRLRQSEFGGYDLAWLQWHRGGSRGPKPRTKITDGRMDAINEVYELKGARRVGGFTEALYHSIPTSRRWLDLEPRLSVLSDAAGIAIDLPDEALRLQAARLSIEECEREVDQRIAELFAEARAGAGAAAEEVPF